MKRTLLVVHPGAIGDVLVARQALRALRAAYPDHALGLLARRDVGALLRACREVHELFPLEARALTGLLAGPEALPPALGRWLRICDVAVCWMDDPGGLQATLAICGVAHTVVRSVSDRVDRTHRADQLLQTLKGIAQLDTGEARLELSDSIKEEGRAMLRAQELADQKFVMLHPGSGSPHKCVAPGVLATVVDGLHARGISVAMVIGPADEVLARDVLDRCTAKPHVVEGYDLSQTAGILTHAAMFVGHDSGLTHLAAALAVPTIALFGPTDAVRWTPRGAQITVLSGLSCRCDGWQAVKNCMEKPCLFITPERILSACDRVLARNSSALSSAHQALPLPCSPA